MPSLLEILRKTTDHLTDRGVASPRLSAELLVGHALGLPRMQLYVQFERPLSEPELDRIRPLVRRRARHEPLQYIIGSAEFFGVTLKVDRRVLIPRPETEQLVELATRHLAEPPQRILDLGTGSGAIAIALARHFPSSRVTAVDCSPEALELARENATACGVGDRLQLLTSDWYVNLPAATPFEAIVANPPYLTEAEIAACNPEVREYEPAVALGPAGIEGADDLKRIISGAVDHLTPGGLLALETGPTQHAALLDYARAAGLAATESHRDLAGRDRFLLAWR